MHKEKALNSFRIFSLIEFTPIKSSVPFIQKSKLYIMSLKDSHGKVKNYILSYFSLYDIEFIPSTSCSVIDKGKVLIFPVVLGVLTSFTGWHLMFQMTSMENLMDFTFNFNVTVAGVQTIITFICVNLIYKDDFFAVLKYFDDITTSEVEFLTKTRMDHLQSSISIAWKLIR